MGGSISTPLALSSVAQNRSFFASSKPSRSSPRCGKSPRTKSHGVRAADQSPKRHIATKSEYIERSKQSSKTRPSTNADNGTRTMKISPKGTEAPSTKRCSTLSQPKKTTRQVTTSHNAIDAPLIFSLSCQKHVAVEGKKVYSEDGRSAKRKSTRSLSSTETCEVNSAPVSLNQATTQQELKQVGASTIGHHTAETNNGSRASNALNLLSEGDAVVSKPSSAHSNSPSQQLIPTDRPVQTTRCFSKKSSQKSDKTRLRLWGPLGRRAAFQPLPQSVPTNVTSPSSSYKVFFSNGVKVTILSEEFKVFVIDLVSKETCDSILRSTAAHIRRTEKRNGETWRTLYSYTKMDLPCCEIKSIQHHTDRLMKLVAKIIGDVFGDKSAASLHARSWKEPHLLRYQVVEGKPEHRGVELHYDGSHFTWQLMLSDENDYVGGGTYFQCLRKTVRLKKGQVLVHPGELYHKGIDIEKGVRDLVICFMDGFDPQIEDPYDSDGSDSRKYEKRICSV